MERKESTTLLKSIGGVFHCAGGAVERSDARCLPLEGAGGLTVGDCAALTSRDVLEDGYNDDGYCRGVPELYAGSAEEA